MIVLFAWISLILIERWVDSDWYWDWDLIVDRID